MLNRLITILDLAKSTNLKLDYKLTDTKQRYAVFFWGTIQEYASSAITLIDNNSMGGISSILRSTIEAHFDLLNLKNVENYDKMLEMNFYKQRERIEKERDNPDNLFVPERTEEDPEIDFKKVFEELKKHGVETEMNNRERFKLSGSEAIYTSVYWLLCQESHNNLSALLNKHDKASEKDTVIDALAGILTVSMELIQGILNIDLEKEIQKAKEQLAKIRG